jgi:dihydroflavonol-4-reductase
VPNLFVTGASGLVGANLCLTALSRGLSVTALVRDAESRVVLSSAGCRVVTGDLADLDALAEGMKGADAVVHAAAVIGGTWSTATPEDFERINYQGVVNVLDVAGRSTTPPRCVLLNTGAILDMSVTMTETSPTIPISRSLSGYTTAKLSAYYLALHRACRGADCCVVMPGGIYGPSPMVERAIVPTSFNSNLLGGLRGEFQDYLGMSLTWVYVQEVVDVSLAAAERGAPGRRYLAMGRPDDVCSLPSFCNRMNELAGVAHRVREVSPQDDPARFGSMARFAGQKLGNPPVDPSGTTTELGVAPTPQTEGLERTLAWFRDHGLV